VKLLTALLIGSCARLSQYHSLRFFEFGDRLGFWVELLIDLQHRILGMEL